MARTVTVLPPTINRQTAAPIGSKAKRKVAAYARVSTEHEEQQSSYEAQCDYYTNFIRTRDDWEFAGIYSDEGISATSTKHREGFQQMVSDALEPLSLFQGGFTGGFKRGFKSRMNRVIVSNT